MHIIVVLIIFVTNIVVMTYSSSVLTNISSDLPGFVLERTAKRMKQFFQEHLNQLGAGITVDQWVILQLLDQHSGMSQLDIARATYKDAPTVTRMLDLMCGKQLTVRIADPHDRRRFQIELTPQGREKIAEVLPHVEAARRMAWQGFSDSQLRSLLEGLERVYDNLELSPVKQTIDQ